MELTLICSNRPKGALCDSAHPIVLFGQLQDWAVSPTLLERHAFFEFSPDDFHMALRGVMFGVARYNINAIRVDSPNSRENDVRGRVEEGVYDEIDCSEEQNRVDCNVSDTDAA